MAQGQTYEPLISFALSGQANGKQPYWAWDHKDFAPRFAIAYAPKADIGLSRRLWGGPGKTSIRVGYGLYHDHFGEGITNSFDRNGSFGLTTSITNLAGVQTVDTSARFSALNTIPPTSDLRQLSVRALPNRGASAATSVPGDSACRGHYTRGIRDHLGPGRQAEDPVFAHGGLHLHPRTTP